MFKIVQRHVFSQAFTLMSPPAKNCITSGPKVVALQSKLKFAVSRFAERHEILFMVCQMLSQSG